MCGRFNVIDNPELQHLLRELGIDLGLPSRSNIAPTENIFLVRQATRSDASGMGSELVEVRWWLTPHWAKQVDQKYSMFNARSETIAQSRAFSEPFHRRRGIVPVSSFIEWRTEEGGTATRDTATRGTATRGTAKQPYMIAAVDDALALAAVWDRWEGGGQVIESCALVTTAAAPEFEQIHKRMPVMLSDGERARWLDCSSEILADDPLFAAVLKFELNAVPISRGVNNARNKEWALLEPVGDEIHLGGGGLPR
jgi:putative SOS response-associated peptidase YedK